MSIETKRIDDMTKEEIPVEEKHFELRFFRCFSLEANDAIEVACCHLSDANARKVYEIIGLDFNEAVSEGEVDYPRFGGGWTAAATHTGNPRAHRKGAATNTRRVWVL